MLAGGGRVLGVSGGTGLFGPATEPCQVVSYRTNVPESTHAGYRSGLLHWSRLATRGIPVRSSSRMVVLGIPAGAVMGQSHVRVRGRREDAHTVLRDAH